MSDKNLYVLPARGNGKTFTQMKIYEELLKGENEMFGIKKCEDVTKLFDDAIERLTKEKVEQIDKPEPAPEVEEWVWVKGYKGTRADMTCNDYQYEFGKQHDMPEDTKIELCRSGFHFCTDLSDVFRYYDIRFGNRFFEVEALVRKDGDYRPDIITTYNLYAPHYQPRYDQYDSKRTAKSIRFIRELTVDEVFAALRCDDVKEWSDERKKRAMEAGINVVRHEIKIDELVAAKYSEAMAKYIIEKLGKYDVAKVLASQPGLSMDAKVITLFAKN